MRRLDFIGLEPGWRMDKLRLAARVEARMTGEASRAYVFWRLFLEAFERQCESNRAAMIPIWESKTAWTGFMLKPNEGFLGRVAKAWAGRCLNEPCIERNEWHKFDLMLLTAPPGKEWWRCVPVVTIEHENDDAIHDEVWKLACWRSRLKVLVTYHNSDSSAAEKRARAREIITNIQGACDDGAEWLMLSAPREWGDRLAWTGHEWTGDDWKALTASG